MSRIVLALAALCFAGPIHAQKVDSSGITAPHPLENVTITATRTKRSTFDTPQPVTVLDSSLIREKLPNGIADLFRDVAGLDASGVGANQRRPEIRGFRGQRILLLQDGLRLNNSRRQQDFGELPALAGISGIDRVEIVRGPSSVLYGTDAIGGVINLISRRTPVPSDNRIRGELSYRYGSAGALSEPAGSVGASLGRFAVRAGAAFRNAEPYRSPSGTFGNIRLTDSEPVHDSGVRDRSIDLAGSYEISSASQVYARVGWYSADSAGFGYIDPAKLGPDQPTIRIQYPDQQYARYSLGYRATALSRFFADRVDATTYFQSNERHLNTFVLVPAGPGATVDSKSYNFTDLATVGGRLELSRSFGSSGILTYGVDAFRDRSRNTDSSRTIITGFGPLITRTSRAPQVPNADFVSAGAFAQLELHPLERMLTIVGARYQKVSAETDETEGLVRPAEEGSDATGVWSLNSLYRLTSGLNLVASAGRGFRAANIVERFFEGTRAEGGGFQRANAGLLAETSVNVDLGLRYRAGPFYSETFVFRNNLSNAIRAVATGETVNRLAVFQNRNVSRLRIQGLEVTGGMRFASGIAASLNAARLEGRNISDPDSPVGDSYSTKVVGDIAYRSPMERVTIGYTVRHQGEQHETLVAASPVGAVIPAFTVHSARGSLRLFSGLGLTHHLALSVDNIGNMLYAEFPNASFFRPEPGRNATLAVVTRF